MATDVNNTEKIINDFKAQFSKSAVLSAARRDGERPFGPIICWLRDYFGIPKSQGVEIAMRIISDYGLEEEQNKGL